MSKSHHTGHVQGYSDILNRRELLKLAKKLQAKGASKEEFLSKITGPRVKGLENVDKIFFEEPGKRYRQRKERGQ